jgi:hypothetical protein
LDCARPASGDRQGADVRNGGENPQDAPNDIIKEVLGKGLMLADIWSVNGRWIGSEEAIEIRNGSIDPSVFAPPLGYVKVESLAAKLIRSSADAEFSAVGACSHTLFTAGGVDDDKNVAWDAAKRAWRSCVTGRLGEKWTFTNLARISHTTNPEARV